VGKIRFHSESRTVEIADGERLRLAWLCVNLAAGVFELLSDQRRLSLSPVGLSESDRPHGREQSFDTQFRMLLASSFGGRSFADGARIFDLVLNTAMVVGSVPVALAASLHGRCEQHAYVEPQDARWLAAIVAEGLRDGVFRDDAGWTGVADLLRAEPGPVVTSYSTCDEFPNPAAARWVPRVRTEPADSDDWGTWYAQPFNERWRLAMAGLRSRVGSPRLDPADWPRPFGDGRTAFHYVNDVNGVSGR
jgi:hypothetical protein